MSFFKKYNDIMIGIKGSVPLTEQDTPAMSQDAAAPDPAAQPAPSSDETPQPVAPEGYVSMVKMLAKALVMDVPAGEIDAVFTGNNITAESAFDIQNQLKNVMKVNEVNSNNIERLNNSNYLKFVETINEKNFMQRYNSLLNFMKSKSPNV